VDKYAFQNYEIPSYVLPLEGESEANENKLQPTYHKKSETKKKFKKRRPTPTDDFLADNPYSTSNKVTKYESEMPSIDELIQKELEFTKNIPISHTVHTSANIVEIPSGMKVTKRRRLKKRKLQKDPKPEASALHAKGVKCPLSHKEKVVPEESSHSFVIVAADDAL